MASWESGLLSCEDTNWKYLRELDRAGEEKASGQAREWVHCIRRD